VRDDAARTAGRGTGRYRGGRWTRAHSSGNLASIIDNNQSQNWRTGGEASSPVPCVGWVKRSGPTVTGNRMVGPLLPVDQPRGGSPRSRGSMAERGRCLGRARPGAAAPGWWGQIGRHEREGSSGLRVFVVKHGAARAAGRGTGRYREGRKGGKARRSDGVEIETKKAVFDAVLKSVSA